MSTLTGLIGGGGGSSLFPTFPLPVTAANASFMQLFPDDEVAADTFLLPGHNSNGDYYRWSADNASYGAHSLIYYNNAGSAQWSVNDTDITGSAGTIASICKIGSTIYMMHVDASTSAMTLATVNESGTITNTSTLSQTLITSQAWPYYCSLCQPTGSSNLIFTSGAANMALEINPSTGAIVNSTSVNTVRPRMLVTPDNRAMGFDTVTDYLQCTTLGAGSSIMLPKSFFPIAWEGSDFYDAQFLQWGTFLIVIGHGTGTTNTNRGTASAIFNKADVEQWVEDTLDVVGAPLTLW